MAIHSWCGTAIQFEITDENAAAYNRIVDALHQVPADTDPKKIQIVADHADFEVYNKVANIINQIIGLNGGFLPYKEEDITTDYLVKV